MVYLLGHHVFQIDKTKSTVTHVYLCSCGQSRESVDIVCLQTRMLLQVFSFSLFRRHSAVENIHVRAGWGRQHTSFSCSFKEEEVRSHEGGGEFTKKAGLELNEPSNFDNGKYSCRSICNRSDCRRRDIINVPTVSHETFT